MLRTATRWRGPAGRVGALVLACILLAAGGKAAAQASFDPASRVLRLDGGGVTVALTVTGEGLVRSLYWGPALSAGDPLHAPAQQDGPSSNDPRWGLVAQEYAGWGGGLLDEPALKLSYADGNRDLVLHYASHALVPGGIELRLHDIERPVEVVLHYRLDAATGLLARSASIRNGGKEPLRVEQAMAGSATLPPGGPRRLRYLTGRWGAEFGLHERPIDEAATVLESRRGVSGHAENPWFAIGAAETAEEAGPVWFGALAWSGSWRLTVQRDLYGEVRVTAGYNPFDFGYVLAPGATLETPELLLGYSGGGWGAASRLLHDYERAHVLPQATAPRLRPVLYNSWEATEFDFDAARQMAIADQAARLGVERFVMDDGWFGQRDSDRAGLGDWTPNPRKFPQGLKPLIDHVRALGMDFGLWVEPEMVNPDSELYRKHPDWVIHFPGRPRTQLRNQLVLNLARADVRAYVLGVLDRLVSENAIAFLKWDHNRYWTEPGWPERAPEEQRALYVDYVRNLYAIVDELRRRHPGLEIEDCASGGGRADLGMLARTDETWTSDNTDPYDRLAIQDGYTQAYAPLTMAAWVTDSPNWVNHRGTTLAYRFYSAMQGALGIGANLDRWSEQDFDAARALVAGYKSVRATVQLGDLYRLEPPREGTARSATLSVAKDRVQAALFVFLHSSSMRETQTPVLLRGLDPSRQYRARLLDGGALPAGVPAQASGAYWMNAGVDLTLVGDFAAAGIAFEAVP